MDIARAVVSIGTSIELKRIASAYVIDYRNLSDDKIREAIIKTGPQYAHEPNVKKSLAELLLHTDRDYRLVTQLILKRVLLHKDGFMCPRKDTEDDLIAYEQAIINKSNEDTLQKNTDKSKNLELFRFILETAWEDGSVSPDEKNLLEKLKSRLRITDDEYYALEAKLECFPKQGNTLHTRSEIESVRRALQAKGLLFTIRNSDNVDFDLIPDEVASVLRKLFSIEMRRHGYVELINYKHIRSKPYLVKVLSKCGITIEGTPTLDVLKQMTLEQVLPSVLLGGLSPRDGLDQAILKKWCSELALPISGTKNESIQRIIDYYDAILEKDDSLVDDRELWYLHFEKLACRDLDFLRNQQIITKDLECEKKFEEATNYLFEKKLLHKPLTLVGSAHADGALSFQNKVIYWDNKSKETLVNLKDHIRQFDGYVRLSEKPVACFLVIAPDFTEESSLLAMQYQVEAGTTITLIRAHELKTIAEGWNKKNLGKKTDDPFPLGYLIQPGLVNMSLISSVI